MMEYSDKSRRIVTASKESDDSDDEIIVKTTSWPVHQAASIDSNGLDCTDKESDLRDSSKNTSDDDDFRGKGESGNKKNYEVNGESGGTNDIADEVIEKVQRGRMEFPCSSECSSAPTKSCLNNHNSSSCEHSHHKPKTSNKKTNHQELSEDNNSKLQSNSVSTKKKTFCYLS